MNRGIRAALALLGCVFGCACGPDGGEPPASGSEDAAAAPEMHLSSAAATAPDEVARAAPRARRVLVAALDGATWRVADPLLAEGRLPNLARWIEAGVRAELETLEPTVSPAIWTTIATGTLPAEHGILGFDGVPGRTMQTLPNSRMRRRKAYWEILPEFGVRTGTVGYWATWPADPMPEGSFLLSDRVTYTRMEASVARTNIAADDAWPRPLLEAVADEVQRPDAIDPDVARRFLGMGPEEMRTRLLGAEYAMGRFLPEFKFVYQSDLSSLRVAQAALALHPVELATVYLTGIDTVSHLFWHFSWPEDFPRVRIDPAAVERYGDVIPLYYQEVDRWLGELAEGLGEDLTVVVVSDHGFGPTGNLPWSGGHGRLTRGAPIAPPGLLVLSGPGIVEGPVRLPHASVLDVAPTLLALFGVPPGRDMPGRVLEEALAPGEPLPERVASHERIGRVRSSAAPVPVDTEGDAERLERLRALGYVQ